MPAHSLAVAWASRRRSTWRLCVPCACLVPWEEGEAARGSRLNCSTLFSRGRCALRPFNSERFKALLLLPSAHALPSLARVSGPCCAVAIATLTLYIQLLHAVRRRSLLAGRCCGPTINDGPLWDCGRRRYRRLGRWENTGGGVTRRHWPEREQVQYCVGVAGVGAAGVVSQVSAGHVGGARAASGGARAAARAARAARRARAPVAVARYARRGGQPVLAPMWKNAVGPANNGVRFISGQVV